jgi:hypothetical protein
LADTTENQRVPQLNRMAALELNVTRVSLQVRHSILARTPEEQSAALADIGAKRKLIDEDPGQLREEPQSTAARERFALPPLVAGFWREGEANIRLIQDGKKAEAFAYLVDKTIPARNLLLVELADTVASARQRRERGHAPAGADRPGQLDLRRASAPKNRPARCSRPRRRWNSWVPPCARTPTTRARPTSWPGARRRWRPRRRRGGPGGGHHEGHQRQQRAASPTSSAPSTALPSRPTSWR